jgi:integrase/recombinase XerD
MADGGGMSTLGHAVEAYLSVRRALGFKLATQGRLLIDFVRYAEGAGDTRVTTTRALQWALLPPDQDPIWCAVRLRVVRGFARHQIATDPATEVPPTGLLPQVSRRTEPYLFTHDDITRVMHAARSLRAPLKAATYEAIIGLLAVTGMRVGEACRLQRAGVDWDERVITIENSKYQKSRAIPLHPTTITALQAYAQRRDALSVAPDATTFFVSTTGTPLITTNVRDNFARLTRNAGLTARSARCWPRLRDLRHTFALTTLLSWYRQGIDVQQRLPLLSTYLGHIDPSSTYWYVHAAPELFSLVAQRLERVAGETP